MKFTVEAQKLRNAIGIAYRFADPEPKQYEASAVLIECEGGKLSCVSTDRIRLSYCEIGNGPSEDFQVLIPYKTAKELAGKIGKTSRGDVVFSVEGASVSVSWRSGNYKQKEFTFQQTEGRFPRWKGVIPNEERKKGALTGSLEDLLHFFHPEKRHETLLLNGSVKKSARDGIGLKYDGEAESIMLDFDMFGEWLEAISEPTNGKVEISVFGSEDVIAARCGGYNYIQSLVSTDR